MSSRSSRLIKLQLSSYLSTRFLGGAALAALPLASTIPMRCETVSTETSAEPIDTDQLLGQTEQVDRAGSALGSVPLPSDQEKLDQLEAFSQKLARYEIEPLKWAKTALVPRCSRQIGRYWGCLSTQTEVQEDRRNDQQERRVPSLPSTGAKA
jgi:hypothetical protein